MNDGLYKQCRFCVNQRQKQNDIENRGKKRKYYNENHDKIKKYRSDNIDKRNECFRKREDLDLIYKIACNLRSRTSSAFKPKSISKMNKTFDSLRCFLSFLKNWINHHIYSNVTLENCGSVWQIDHCLAIASFIILDEKETKQCFNWIILRPMLVKDNFIEVDKIDMRLYLIQELKSNFFMKLNVEEGYYKNFY